MQHYTPLLLALALTLSGCVTTPPETPPKAPTPTAVAPPVVEAPKPPPPILTAAQATKLAPTLAIWVASLPEGSPARAAVTIHFYKPQEDYTDFIDNDLSLQGPVIIGEVNRARLVALAKDARIAAIDSDATLLDRSTQVARWSRKIPAAPVAIWLLGVSPADLELPREGEEVVVLASFMRSLTADEQAYFAQMGLLRFHSKVSPNRMGDPQKGRPELFPPIERPLGQGLGLSEDFDFTIASGPLSRSEVRTLLADHRLLSIDVNTGNQALDQIDVRALQSKPATTLGPPNFQGGLGPRRGPGPGPGRRIKFDDPSVPDPNRPPSFDLPPLDDDDDDDEP